MLLVKYMMLTDTKDLRNEQREPPVNDVALTAAAGRGDRRAQAELAERVYDRVRTTVRYLCCGHRDEEDFVQMVLAEILKSCGSFRGESTFELFANRIAIRKTLRLLKQRKFRDRAVVLNEDSRTLVNDVDRSLNQYVLRRNLSQIMGNLSVKYRSVLVPRLVFGYSIEEIAQMVDSPKATVRQRLRRGRKILMEAVAADPVFAEWLQARNK